MRRTTSTTLLEEARLLTHLLKHAPDQAIAHHADAFRSFLEFLHQRTEITHTVSDLLPGRSFPHPDALLAGAASAPWKTRVVGSRKYLSRLFGELTDRKVRLNLRSR